MSEGKHTPTPWAVERTALAGPRLVHGEPEPVHGFRDDVPIGRSPINAEAHANLDFIVLAVNAHADLLAALASAPEPTITRSNPQRHWNPIAYEKWFYGLRAAALAKVKQP